MSSHRVSELLIRPVLIRPSYKEKQNTKHLILSNREKSLLNIAIRTAEDSECSSQHGAIVVKAGRVMSIATNRYRNCPEFTPSDNPEGKGTIFSYHAETRAMSRVLGDSIYVARVNSSGAPRLSMPCDNCLESIIDAGFKKVVFTTTNGAGKIFI